MTNLRSRIFKTKRKLYIAFLLFAATTQAQTVLQNTGNLRIHKEGRIGFHVDLRNDGSFDENVGLVGFFGNDIRNIGGSLPTTFFDAEFMTENGTFLDTALNVSNNVNFISGNVSTPRTRPMVSLKFMADAFSSGEGDPNKVDGYASMNGQRNFTFPVGDVAQLRPLILNSQTNNDFAKCAYFLEDPNTPTTFVGSFDTTITGEEIEAVSTREFWRLEGSVPSSVQLSWNDRSFISALTNEVSDVVIVGWSKSTNQWENLGGPESFGELAQGIAVSASFVPNDYEVLSFGTSRQVRDYLDLDNYLVTPNGDGINDFLKIPELNESPNNRVMIFDRRGLKVFDRKNYTDEFNGFATGGKLVSSSHKKLPTGVYFYLVSLDDLDLEFQGFLYLACD